jgi:hypothetical protein
METLAGFVLHEFGELPHEGASIEIDDHRFTVKTVTRNRIANLLVESLNAGQSATISPAETALGSEPESVLESWIGSEPETGLGAKPEAKPESVPEPAPGKPEEAKKGEAN